MKHLSALLVLGSALFVSCEEEPLPIVTEDPIAPLLDTTYVTGSPSAKQDKIVLFEEFTGVRCPTCPNGHIAVKNMQNNYPDRIAAVAVHPGTTGFPLATPFAGEEDYNTTWGASIFTVITQPTGIPYGIADRITASNTSSQWEPNTLQQMNLITVANADARILSYDPLTRELRFEVKFEVTSDVNEALFFSTVITEDSLIGKQEHQTGFYDKYVHNHILRDMPQFKLNLNPGNVPAATTGRVFLKQYAYILPVKCKPEHCRLIAYIHKDVEILQAVELHIQ